MDLNATFCDLDAIDLDIDNIGFGFESIENISHDLSFGDISLIVSPDVAEVTFKGRGKKRKLISFVEDEDDLSRDWERRSQISQDFLCIFKFEV